ncbi:MAG: SAM-dependent methyltransferase [Chitinophagaceae bacterium]
MPNLSHRTYQKELLDRDDIPFADIKRNMQELDFINRTLGGHNITLQGLKRLLRKYQCKEPINIVEIGCGGGDNLRVVKKWLQKNKIPAQLTGVDINKECIAFAQSQESNSGIKFIESDYRIATFDTKPHIIFSSLFCHHFTDNELQEMMQWLKQNSSIGFFINDLHRHLLAYCSIKFLTRLFSKSYLVKNDAPLSVQRAFRKKDWQTIVETTNGTNFKIQWRWAFRWLITYTHEPATTI